MTKIYIWHVRQICLELVIFLGWKGNCKESSEQYTGGRERDSLGRI